MSPRAQQRAETLDRILDAAQGRVDDVGDDFTLDEVARAAGVTRMTIHRHVGGREQLLTQLALREVVRLVEELRPILDAPAAFDERVVEAMARVVSFIRESGPLMNVFGAQAVTELWPLLDPDQEVGSAALEFFLPYYEEAERFGVLRSDARSCNYWVVSQALLYLVVPPVAPDDESVRRLLRTFVVPGILRHPA